MNIHHLSTNHFQALWDLGYKRLCPIIPPGAPISERSNLAKRIAKGDDARGKVPGIRWPDGTWSGFDFVKHESTEADLPKWSAMGAGVGIKTGDGLVLIDADTKNPEWADKIKTVLHAMFGDLPIRIGNFPKAGYLVRTDADFTYQRIEFGHRNDKGLLTDRVEILSEGRQFVAQGIHPATLRPYVWPAGVPSLADVPFVAGSALTAFLEALRPILPAAGEVVKEGAVSDVDQDSLRAPLDLVEKAVKATPNTSALFPSRESYRDFGYAIKAAAGEDGWPVYLDWCLRWEDGENDPDVARADWDRMKPPYRRGASWLFEVASEATGQDFAAAQWFEPVAEPLFPVENGGAEGRSSGSAAAVRRFSFVTFDDAASRAVAAQQRPLIKGLMDWGAMTILYGPSNVGKTFVAMDLAFHVAAGLPFGGMRTERGAVVYVAAEGGRGVYGRVAALKAKYGAAAIGVPFHVLPASVDLRRRDADLGPLVAAIRGIGEPVALIVVDTLSRAMAGGDENSSVDMGNIVSHFDVLRGETSAHLMVVHHTGKNVAQGARGHSLLRAATDTEIEISEGVFAVTKQRDLPKNWSAGFALDVVKLGVDADGDDITSCTIRLIDKGDPMASIDLSGLSGKELAVLRAVSELDAFEDDPGAGGATTAGATLRDVEDYLAKSIDRMSKETIRHALRALSAKGAIRKAGRGKWAQNRQIVDWRDRNFTDCSTNCSGESGEEISPNVFE